MRTLSLDSVVVAGVRQVSADLNGEAVILDLERGMYYGLNDVGARIWALIQEPRALTQVRDQILREFAVDPERCEADLLTLLRQLADRELVEIHASA